MIKNEPYLHFLEDYCVRESPRYIYYLCRTDGKLVRILPNERFSDAIREVSQAGRIDAFFDWPGRAALRTGAPFACTSKRNFAFFQSELDFHSSLPLGSTNGTFLKKDLILGRIAFSDILPNAQTDRMVQFIYVDHDKGTLKGFNTAFHNLIQERYPAPEKLLDRPLSEVFSRFPDLQPALSPEPLVETEAETLLYEQGLDLLLKGGDEEALHAINIPLNTFQDNISIEVESVTLAGDPLLLYLSPGPQETDAEGYMAGVSVNRKLFIFKRRSYYFARAAVRELPAVSMMKWSLHQRRLSLSINGKVLLAHKDLNFLASESARFILAARPGSEIRVRSIRVTRVASPLKSLSAEEYEAGIHLGRRRLTFNLERFYNKALASNIVYLPVAAYYLYNVTGFSNQVLRLDSKVRRLEKQVTRFEPLTREQPLIGSGPRIRTLREWAESMSRTGATVLIEGPTGSGKEILARSIHAGSARRIAPFIKVDCATIPSTLIESQLFGHEKGAFTGAEARFIGFIERANHGTLFLDEISNLALPMQAKLLQFLNDFTVTRVGGTQPLKLDVRCIAASNRPLNDMIREGAFREDLYYRLAVFQTAVPSLNERREDIPELATHFLAYFNILYRKDLRSVSPEAMRVLEQHDWRGNIREFRNCMERAVLFASTERIETIGFDESVGTPKPRSRLRMNRTDPETVKGLLKKHGGHVMEAVRETGASPGAFYYFLRTHRINPDDYRQGFTSTK